MQAEEPICLSAVSAAPIRALRFRIQDLLVLEPDGSLILLTHGTEVVPLRIEGAHASQIVSLKDPLDSSVTVCYQDGTSARTTIKLTPRGSLTVQVLQILSTVLPRDEFFSVHHDFLLRWARTGFNQTDEVSFPALRSAIYAFLYIKEDGKFRRKPSSWETLHSSSSVARYQDDPAFTSLELPHPPIPSEPSHPKSWKPNPFHGAILTGLHYIGQDRLLNTHLHDTLSILVPVICKLAMIVRPEWADYWKRLLPDAIGPWPSPAKSGAYHMSRPPCTISLPLRAVQAHAHAIPGRKCR